MKKHLALFAAAFAIGLVASSAIAQDTTTPTTPTTTKKAKSGGASANKAASDLAALTTTLSLTDDQQARIKPILLDEASKLHGGKKAAAGPDADAAKAKNKAIRDDTNKQIRALLTPDQQKTFDAMPKKSGKKAAAPAPAPAV
jgi:hypothetical protein